MLIQYAMAKEKLHIQIHILCAQIHNTILLNSPFFTTMIPGHLGRDSYHVLHKNWWVESTTTIVIATRSLASMAVSQAVASHTTMIQLLVADGVNA